MRRPIHRSSRGSALIEVAIVLVMSGLLATIAIPRFLAARSRAHQAEVRQNLKSRVMAQRALYQEKARYEGDLRALGFTIERGNRYAYYFDLIPECELRDTEAPVTHSAAVRCIAVDRYAHGFDRPSFPAWPLFGVQHTGQGDAPGFPGLGGPCPGCNISAIAVGDIDDEPSGQDSWYVSTANAEVSGRCGAERGSVQAGTPINVYDDVECDRY
jgi:type IV pilus assembly protein PilA